MKPTFTLFTVLLLVGLHLLLAPLAVLDSAELTLSQPVDFQVVQRTTPGKGFIHVSGELSEDTSGQEIVVESRIGNERQQSEWRRVGGVVVGRKINGLLEAPAGGWWKFEVRVLQDGKVFASGGVEHIGIGEVFVIAGQSNSANHGEEKQTTKTKRVASFDGKAWRLADDPQPGASGSGGSFVPPFADAVVEKENVPVGIIACGIGATSVREWLPKGATFPNPPTLVGRVEQLPNGEWASKGAAFDMFVARMKSLGPHGVRAVLWHQGESDANQKDAARTLSGKLYRESLEKLIKESRRAIGWDVPWFVAQASYHIPGDEGSDEIRAAQASLWKDGLALAGPDSDALKGELRERNGQGVHFSGKGLREHGVKWAEKVLPWLARESKLRTAAPPARAELKLAAMFSDHMVLQRDQRVPVWGWSTASDEVSVSFGGQTKKATADQAGKWCVMLDAMPASREMRTMTVSAKDTRTEIRDVLVGEVWLCAGQSNMAMTVDGKTGWLYIGGVANAKEIVRESANPLLRQFAVDWKTDTKIQEQCTGRWTVAGPETTADFTATGYFFARELQQRLQVPVGILSASFGGSSVEGWTSREALAKASDEEFVAKMNQLIDDYDHHEQRVADFVAALAKWEAKHDRSDPKGADDDQEWAATKSDSTEWKKVVLPASLAKLECPDGGVVWLRREIEVPTEFGTAWRLDFPACRTSYTVFLNGVKIFEATSASRAGDRPSRPTVGKGIANVGKNTLTIKLHGYSGAGGIAGGTFSVVPFNPKFQAVPLMGDWLCRIERAFPALRADDERIPVAPVKGTLHWMPVQSQFNAMLHPLIPFGMRGAVWYQGESNVGNSRYTQHLRILINDWRQRWGIGDFPFYLCQLPGFGARKLEPADSAWAECREMQAAVLTLPNTGLANLIDTCEDGDLHPLNKQEVGRRLALLALTKTYGVPDLVASGPTFDSLTIENGKAIIRFQHADDGLVARPLPATFHPNLRKPELPKQPLALPSPGSELQGFTICDESRRWVNAQAKIAGATVVVWSDEVRNPIAVRYGWADHPVVNLTNKAGLPAFPFRTDSSPEVGMR